MLMRRYGRLPVLFWTQARILWDHSVVLESLTLYLDFCPRLPRWRHLFTGPGNLHRYDYICSEWPRCQRILSKSNALFDSIFWVCSCLNFVNSQRWSLWISRTCPQVTVRTTCLHTCYRHLILIQGPVCCHWHIPVPSPSSQIEYLDLWIHHACY